MKFKSFAKPLFALLPALLLAVGSIIQVLGAEEEDFTIRPGVGVGELRLGMTQAQIDKTLGKPDGRYSMSHGVKAQYSQWKDPGRISTVRIFFGPDGKALQISVEQSAIPSKNELGNIRLSTADGINLGSSQESIFQKYQGLQRNKYRAKAGRVDYYDNTKRGIAFEFGWPESEGESKKHLYAIIVHSPGKPVLADSDERAVH